ncbi:MAG: response regulator [Nitrospirae bacterium]|nr:response regulator [Nitrospirota bacterium]
MKNRLLIIDDEPHICEGLKDRLEAMGHDVIVAHDGRTGLALMALEARGVPLNGVLLDVHMPVMDGIEVLRELLVQHPGVPVLMMSAGSDRRVLQEAVRMGARDYVLKPFDATLLNEICAQVFPLREDGA